MPDFIDRHSIIARVLLLWIAALVTQIVWTACNHPTDLSPSFAAFAGAVLGLPASIITYLQWSRGRAG